MIGNISKIVLLLLVIFILIVTVYLKKESIDSKEITNIEYVVAKNSFKEHPATKDMYRKFLNDRKITKKEYYNLMTTKSEYTEKENREEAEKIKNEYE